VSGKRQMEETSIAMTLDALNKVKIAAIERQIADEKARENLPLDDWEDDRLTLINSIARSDVFPVAEKGERKVYQEPKKVYSQKYVEITILSGVTLNMYDCEVYQHVMQYFRKRGPNEKIAINPHKFLKQMGRVDGKFNREWLWNSLRAIAKNVLEITIENSFTEIKRTYVGPLFVLANDSKDGLINNIEIALTNEAVRLYLNDSRTYIFADSYKKLKGSGSQLAKKLLLIIASHNKPYAMYLETYRKIVGSKAKEMWKFKQSMKIALDLLVQKKEIYKYVINKQNKLYIYRTEKAFKEVCVHIEDGDK
jgi:hypothetical protein